MFDTLPALQSLGALVLVALLVGIPIVIIQLCRGRQR